MSDKTRHPKPLKNQNFKSKQGFRKEYLDAPPPALIRRTAYLKSKPSGGLKRGPILKSALVALIALVSISSAFADSKATLTIRNGVETPTITGLGRGGQPMDGVLSEVPHYLLKATRVLKVKRYPDASTYAGSYISGDNACPAVFCNLPLKISQKAGVSPGPSRALQRITKVDNGVYEIRGDAAGELYDVLVDGGAKVRKSTSKMPGTLVSGGTFICSKVPLNGVAYRCTLSVNADLR